MRAFCLAMFALLLAGPAAALDLKSADIENGQPLAVEHNYSRCGGKNISPGLSWSGVPANARSLVLTVIDTAVKPNGWSHWVVVDLPARDGMLAKGATTLPPGAHALTSDFGDAVYDGPCPPAGSGVHRYEFTIWALPDATAASSDGSAKIGAWLEQHAIAKARLSGTVTAR